MMPRSRQLSALLVLFCTALALAAASCSDDDDPTRPQPTTTAPDTTQPQPETETDEQALEALAEDWYEASREAYRNAEFDLATVERYLVDPYLSAFVAAVEDYRAQGQTSRPGEASRHVIGEVAVDDESGFVEECIVDAEVLLDEVGAVVNDEIVTSRTRTSAVMTSSGWRFSDREVLGDEEGGDQCDE
jgi:hypothetical protein